jgi:hypothetical protein
LASFRSNANTLTFDIIITFPKVTINGKYSLFLALFGIKNDKNEDFTMTLENSKLFATIKANPAVVNGKQTYKINPIKIKYNHGILKNIKMSNLFNNNKALSETVHASFYQRPDLIMSLYPQIEENISKLLTTLANQIVELN